MDDHVDKLKELIRRCDAALAQPREKESVRDILARIEVLIRQLCDDLDQSRKNTP